MNGAVARKHAVLEVKLGPEDVIIQPHETEELRAEDRIVIHLIVTKFPVKVCNSTA